MTTKDSRIFDEKSLLCKPRAEISLEWLSHKRGAGIKDLSQKAESTNAKALALLLVALAVGGCCTSTTQREAVYIPTKCKTKPIPKPTPSKESSISQDVAEILQYIELVEKDLEFCRGE